MSVPESSASPAPAPAPASNQVEYRNLNGTAIGAIIFAFLLPPLGLVLGFVALNEIKTSHERGDYLAIASIVIGMISTLYVVLMFATI